jgi:hypothetical protein
VVALSCDLGKNVIEHEDGNLRSSINPPSMDDNTIPSWLEGIRSPEPIQTDDDSDEYDSDDGVELLVRVY